MMYSVTDHCARHLRRCALCVVALIAILFIPVQVRAAFGLTSSGGNYVVDTGGGLVFKINQDTGDLVSMVYGGKELQDQSKFSHIGSGWGSGATTSATTYGTSYIKITVTDSTGTLTNYYMARNGFNIIYMATYITAEPGNGELRYIYRLNTANLPNAPTPSDNRGNTGAIESSDVFGRSDGTTRSKYYGNDRALDLDNTVLGVTGSGVGAFMVFGNREKSSGGPFFRDIQHQTGTQNEVYNYMNSGHNQTEAWRTGLHGYYALVVTNGSTPSPAIDFSWIQSGGLNLLGTVPASGRGRVILNGIAGRDTNYEYVVGYSNGTAQYWVKAAASNGACGCYNMIAGTYTMTIYKGELAVHTRSVTVTGGQPTTLNTITVTGDPSAQSVIWRIGNWDGTPAGFKNAANITTMHPSDSRQADWGPVTFNVGSSANNVFPSCQWKDAAVNNPTTITFNLSAAQVAAHTVRIGITAAYAGGRPDITINGWNSANPSPSSQPDSRSLTIGTYRGNNTTYTFSVPASAFVAGTNIMTINVISGSGSSAYLSAAYAYDCVDLF